MNWEKLCPNLKFTIKMGNDNKMGNLHKVSHISNLFSNFKNLSMNWDNYVFHWENWVFEPIGNLLHNAKRLA